MPTPLRGVIAPILTPFNADLSVATDLLVAHAQRLLAAGCVGLAPFGTTGEALSVGSGERSAGLEALIAGGVDPARLIPGTGLCNLPDTVALCRHAVERGCAGVMVLPPFYYKGVSQEGLYAYFARLIDAVARPRLRLYLYHIPQVAGVGIPIPVVARLRADFPDIVVGIKDSSGDWENTERLLAIEGLTVYPGSELPLLQALDRGGAGCISATANLNAAALAQVVALYDAGDMPAARVSHDRAAAFRRCVQGFGPIPAQKYLLAQATGDARWAAVRPPLDPLDPARGAALVTALAKDLGVTLDAMLAS